MAVEAAAFDEADCSAGLPAGMGLMAGVREAFGCLAAYRNNTRAARQCEPEEGPSFGPQGQAKDLADLTGDVA